MSGYDLMKKGDQCLKGGFWSNLFGSNSHKVDEAIEHYTKAANIFKLDKNWKEASTANKKIAEYKKKNGESYSAATSLYDASVMSKKYSLQESIECMEEAIKIYVENGYLNQAAKCNEEIGEWYEEVKDTKKAIPYYTKARDYYDLEKFGKQKKYSTNIKIASLISMELGREGMEEAIRILEEESQNLMKNNLLQFNAKKHLMDAEILYLALGDIVNTSIAFQRHCDVDTKYSASREGKFMNSLIHAVEGKNVEEFTQVLADFDSISPLSDWAVHFLYQVKESSFGVKGMVEDTNLGAYSSANAQNTEEPDFS